MGRVHPTTGLFILLLVTGCAGGTAGTAPGDVKAYGLELPDILEALQRGEGREALTYYEREAANLERQGARLEAVRAYHAAAQIALRLGAYQRGIEGRRAPEARSSDAGDRA